MCRASEISVSICSRVRTPTQISLALCRANHVSLHSTCSIGIKAWCTCTPSASLRSHHSVSAPRHARLAASNKSLTAILDGISRICSSRMCSRCISLITGTGFSAPFPERLPGARTCAPAVNSFAASFGIVCLAHRTGTPLCHGVGRKDAVARCGQTRPSFPAEARVSWIH